MEKNKVSLITSKTIMLERGLGKLGELERGPYPPLLKGPIS